MRISATLVIRNEEALLSRCLESVKSVADEIIVVHDGPCRDKSLEIAKKYQAKIFIQPYIGVAEPHRPFCFEKSAGDWILQIDADEYLSPKAQAEIPALIKNKNIDAYSFAWPYVADGKQILRGPFSKTLKSCLFRKSKLFMIGIAQEYPRTYGVLAKRNDILLAHEPEYNNFTYQIFKEKWLNWAKLQARQIANIEQAPTFNIPDRKSNNIYQNYLFIRKHPILTGIGETLKFIAIYLSRGILWAGWGSMKIAFFELAYMWSVRKYLEYLKYGRKI